MTTQPTLDFDRPEPILPPRHRQGETYDAARDYERLNRQMRAVFDVMQGGAWATLREIHDECGEPEASISARLRGFRQMGWEVLRRRRSGLETAGVWEYRVVPR